MTTLVLTDVDDILLERLRVLASATNRTVEQQARMVLEQALPPPGSERREIVASIAALTPKNVHQTDSVVLLREDRARDDAETVRE